MRALAGSTLSGYLVGQRRFFTFGAAHNIPDEEMMPPSEHALLAFSTYMFHFEGSSHAAIQRALYAVKSCAKFLGFSRDAFTSSQLELLLRGAKKERGPGKRQPRLPITVPVLVALLNCLNRNHDFMMRAAISIGVYGLFRAGELTLRKGDANRPDGPILSRADITWFAGKVVIHLRESKTDIFRMGVDVQLFRNGSGLVRLPSFAMLGTALQTSAYALPSFRTKMDPLSGTRPCMRD
jgi:hypothetical protein